MSYSLAKDVEIADIDTELDVSGATTVSTRDVVRKPQTGLYTGEFGLAFTPNSKSRVGATLNLLRSEWKMNAVTISQISRGIEERLTMRTGSYEENLLDQVVANLNFRHEFTPQSSISADFDFIDFYRSNPTEYDVSENPGLTEDTGFRFRSQAKTPLEIRVGKIDYKNTGSKKIGYELGWKSTFSEFRNNVTVFSQQENEYINNEDFTDIYDMNEAIHAGYISLDWKLKEDLLIKGGLRAEHYQLDLKSLDDGQLIDRTTNNLFPSLHANWKANPSHEFNFSYVNRIQRPGFMILAPYFYFFDPNTLFTGNPTIIPSRVNQAQLDHRWKNLSTSVQFSSETDPVFNDQPEYNTEMGLIIVRPVQGKTNNTATLLISYPFEISKAWTANASVRSARLDQTPIVGGAPVNLLSYNYEASIFQQVKVGDWFDVELTASYYSPYRSGVLLWKERSLVDLGFRKTFQSGVNIAFNIHDLFNTGSQWPMEADLRRSGLFYDWNFDTEGPIFRFSFSHPIRGKSNRSQGPRERGATEELERLN